MECNTNDEVIFNVKEDRSLGTILGAMVGDILGTPFEGTTRKQLLKSQQADASFNWNDFTWGQHMGIEAQLIDSCLFTFQVCIIYQHDLECTRMIQIVL
jgi:hypothetical protein